MKHIKTIALVIAVMSGSAINVSAQGLDLKAPDITGKLNTKVEAKMNELVKQTYSHRGHAQIVELRRDGSKAAPAVVDEKVVYDVRANRF